MAFSYHIAPNTPDSHQMDPWWFVVIVRFAHQRTFDRSKITSADDTVLNVSNPSLIDRACEEKPALLLTNQIVNWNVSYNKGSHTPTASFKALPGRVNLAREVNAGDWCLLWAFDNHDDYARVLQNVGDVVRKNGSVSANGFMDGLKFVGRVNAPKLEEAIEPSTGKRTTAFQFSAVAFGEFDAQIYYNAAHRAYEEQIKSSQLDSVHKIASEVDQYIQSGYPISTLDHQKIWLQVFLGSGPGAASKGFDPEAVELLSIKPDVTNGGLVMSPNDAYIVPNTLARLLGVQKQGPRYVDILNTFIGVQGPSGNSTASRDTFASGVFDETNPSAFFALRGFSPDSIGPPSGTYRPQWISFENTTTWNLLSQFSNQPLNEMYVTMRIGANGKVMPTYTLRQNPLSSKMATQALSARFAMTAFIDLPRWKLDVALVNGAVVGASDSLRFNYVSVQGIDPVGTTPVGSQAFQQVHSPPMADIADIRRNGVRSFITTTNSDVTGIIDAKGPLGRSYNKFMSDILMDQHLKWSGSIRAKGIQEPVAIGDNLEYGGILYHIETITHTGYISAEGRKTFETSFGVSNGISVESDDALDNVMPGEALHQEELPVDFEERKDVFDEGELETQEFGLRLADFAFA